MDATKEGPKFNETDVYRIRKASKMNEGLFLCKLILKKHGTVQIEGMGECISLVSKISQILQKNGFASLQKIGSENVDRDSSRSINPKLTVKLAKSAKFDSMTEDIVLRQWFVKIIDLFKFFLVSIFCCAYWFHH